MNRRALLASALALLPFVSAAQPPDGWEPAGEFPPAFPGAVRAARVAFNHVDNERGTLAFTAFEFEDPDKASNATSLILDDAARLVTEIWEVEISMEPVSSRHLGDETKAYGDGFSPKYAPGKVYRIANVVVRRDRFVWLGSGFRSDKNSPLVDTLDTLEKIVGRNPDGEAVLIDDAWTGGVFAMLPILEDLPEGYSFVDVLRSVATPLPG